MRHSRGRLNTLWPASLIAVWSVWWGCVHRLVAAALGLVNVDVHALAEFVEEEGAFEAHFHDGAVEADAFEFCFVVGGFDFVDAALELDAFAVVRLLHARRQRSLGCSLFRWGCQWWNRGWWLWIALPAAILINVECRWLLEVVMQLLMTLDRGFLCLERRNDGTRFGCKGLSGQPVRA